MTDFDFDTEPPTPRPDLDDLDTRERSDHKTCRVCGAFLLIGDFNICESCEDLERWHSQPVCVCGDYQAQHSFGRGSCGLHHCHCGRFRLTGLEA